MLAKKLFWCQMRHFQRGKLVFSNPFFSSKTRQKSEKQIPGERAQVMFERARTFLQREKWVFSKHLLTSQSKQKSEKLKQKSNQTFSKWKLLRVCNWQEKITIIRPKAALFCAYWKIQNLVILTLFCHDLCNGFCL